MSKIKGKCRRLHSTLIQSDVVLRDYSTAFDLASTYEQKKYPELHRKVVANGIQDVIEMEDYPHTPERVKSYAASCDYRLDPAGAVANAPKRHNLGDVTFAQALEGYSREQLQALSDALKAKFAELKTAGSSESSENVPQNGGEKNA